MDYLTLLSIFDGTKRDFKEGAIVCLVAILMVFLILLTIILITSLVTLIVNKSQKKHKVTQSVVNNSNEAPASLKIDENDEDMMAAILVATIDYRNEVKQDVRVVSIKEVK